jgi:hypothetical protein
VHSVPCLEPRERTLALVPRPLVRSDLKPAVRSRLRSPALEVTPALRASSPVLQLAVQSARRLTVRPAGDRLAVRQPMAPWGAREAVLS